MVVQKYLFPMRPRRRLKKKFWLKTDPPTTRLAEKGIKAAWAKSLSCPNDAPIRPDTGNNAMP
ncbi:predicted protein [Histoplasma mississippiense (nom. inval.)]|uniref:predicted protein n=1 Tax=Ajellomyces capsulatus (strain NAm1 / WU24) TaxID=2059318 RepID=UPI000157D371|nr:predicted protein [Histoplasma mississippiense (nom. inval.)]EDN04513.1 predicted protein [Histoplasma mississippiense (nom. inval.)]